MVTSVPVDQSYYFPRTELAAMSNNIAWLIQDIDKLDGHRQNMMEELKVLRDITLFYNERHPKLSCCASTSDLSVMSSNLCVVGVSPCGGVQIRGMTAFHPVRCLSLDCFSRTSHARRKSGSVPL